MSREIDTAALYRTMQSEHAELLRQLKELRQWWTESDELGRPNYEEMGSRIRNLRDVLAKHFLAEEQDGYLGQALAVAPRFSREVDELREQHVRFLNTLDQFAGRLQKEKQTIGPWDKVRREFEDFVGELERHEHAENTIMQAAFDVDVATGD